MCISHVQHTTLTNETKRTTGAEIGVSNKAVSKWKVVNAKPSIEAVRKLANLFQLSVDDLLN